MPLEAVRGQVARADLAAAQVFVGAELDTVFRCSWFGQWASSSDRGQKPTTLLTETPVITLEYGFQQPKTSV